MRIRRLHSPLLLLFIPAISSTIAASLPNIAVSTESTAPGQGPPHSASLAADAAAVDAARAKSRGVPEAPVDGKDGKPHEGPYPKPPVRSKDSLQVEEPLRSPSSRK